MHRRLFLSLSAMLLCAPGTNMVSAQPTAAESVGVEMVTEKGVITIALDTQHAPITSANFLRYVDQRRFDGIAFYRSMHLDWGTPPNGLIQAGTQNDPKRVLPPIAHEPTSQTGIRHLAGTISMARYAPGTATGDFSIMLSDQPGLDANPSATSEDGKAGYAAFGHVVKGMDVVSAIFDSTRSPTLGQGVMRGQMLDPTVKVLTVRRVKLPPTDDIPVSQAPTAAADASEASTQ